MTNRLQALVLFRLRLVRETEHLPVRVKANRGIVALQGKVRTEALRQRVENHRPLHARPPRIAQLALHRGLILVRVDSGPTAFRDKREGVPPESTSAA